MLGYSIVKYLRYFLNLDVEGSAHDAFGDIVVLEAVFEYLKNTVKNYNSSVKSIER